MAVKNDIVLVYYEDQPVFFARIEDISPDNKKDWYHIRLLVLQVPLQTVTWILKDEYINGGEFTMGGKRMRIETVEAPREEGAPETSREDKPPAKQKEKPDASSESKATVISFNSKKPEKQ